MPGRAAVHEIASSAPSRTSNYRAISVGTVMPVFRSASGAAAVVIQKQDVDIAATSWVFNHNQAKYPLSVHTYDDSEHPIIGDVANPSNNQTTITFSTSRTGRIVLVFES